MSTYRNLITLCAAAVLTLGLAACGGGGSSPTTDGTDMMEPTPQEQIAELQTQINALRAELGLDPIDIDDLTGSVADLTAQVAALQKQIQDAADAEAAAEAEAQAKAMAALGRAMRAALAGNATAGTTALDNIGAPGLTSAGLAVDAAAGAGALADATDPGSVTLRAGDAVAALGSWNGTSYMHSNAETKIVNAAVVYNNKGPGRSRSFADLGYTVATTTSGDDIKGYVTLDETADLPRIMAPAFTHSGIQTHQPGARQDAVYIRGTYDGAAGEYRCAGTDCSSTNDGKGSPSALGGAWHFKPDAGANAMAHQPDTTYLYYGWWVSKDKDGGPTAASAFVGEVFPTGGAAPDSAALDTLTGSATYAGHAAGKFAMSNALDGTGNAGHFTADANLTATFGANAAPNNGGISGTIDNFRLNDGSEDAGWSVALHRAPWGSGNNEFATPTTDDAATMANETMGTTWSINGNAAARSGTWSGQMYDEMPGNPPAGDGSNVPTTVTGTFYSEFSNIGRMVGAFGADKQ